MTIGDSRTRRVEGAPDCESNGKDRVQSPLPTLSRPSEFNCNGCDYGKPWFLRLYSSGTEKGINII